MKNMLKIVAMTIALLFAVNAVLPAGELQQRKSNDRRRTASKKSTSGKQRPKTAVKRNTQKPRVTKGKSAVKPVRYSGSKKNITNVIGKKAPGSTPRRISTPPRNQYSGSSSRGKSINNVNRYEGTAYRGPTYKPQSGSNSKSSNRTYSYSRQAIPRVSTRSNYSPNKSTVKPTNKGSITVRPPSVKGRDYLRAKGGTSTTLRGSAGTQDRRAVSRKVEPQRSKTLTIRSKPSGSETYRGTHVIRTRKGSFDTGKNVLAGRDRRNIGTIQMRNSPTMKGTVTNGLVRTKGGGVRRFGHAKPELARNNYRFVGKDYSGNYMVSRHYLFDDNGRWGHAPTYYNGRNYHFYCTLLDQGFYFGVGARRWSRRFYGDGWDYHFGWNAGIYIPTGSWSYGTPYFEPCYAFSFTFNHGYERGYLEGYLTGMRHWNAYIPYNSYCGGYLGYQSYLGPHGEYIDGYQQGFSQGYYAGYSGLGFGYQNFGFGDFRDYPVIYDFDYDYYSNTRAYDDNYYYNGNSGYEYTDEYYNSDYRDQYPDQGYDRRNE